MSKEKLTVFLVLAAAFALRAYFSASFPVTLDEAWSHVTGRLPLAEVLSAVRGEINPPLTLLFHKVFTAAPTELGIRWAFALAGFLSLFPLARFTKAGPAELLVFASSAYLVSEGSIARMHAFSLLFGSTAVYSFVKTFEREKLTDFVLLACACLAGLYNFYPFGALVAAFALVWAFSRGESASRPRLYLGAFGAVALLALPLLYFYSPAAAGTYAAGAGFALPSGAILAYLPFALSYSEYLLKFGEIVGLNLIYFLALAAVLVPALAAGLRGRREDLRLRLSLRLLAVCAGLVLAVSLKLPKVLYSAKYVIWAYPLFAYVLARGLQALPGRWRAASVALLAAANLAALFTATERNPENWRAAAAFVQERELPGDAVLFDAGHMRYPFGFYYSGRSELKPLPAAPPAALPPELLGYGRVWLVSAHDWGRRGAYRSLLAGTAAPRGVRSLGDIEVSLYGGAANAAVEF